MVNWERNDKMEGLRREQGENDGGRGRTSVNGKERREGGKERIKKERWEGESQTEKGKGEGEGKIGKKKSRRNKRRRANEGMEIRSRIRWRAKRNTKERWDENRKGISRKYCIRRLWKPKVLLILARLKLLGKTQQISLGRLRIWPSQKRGIKRKKKNPIKGYVTLIHK